MSIHDIVEGLYNQNIKNKKYPSYVTSRQIFESHFGVSRKDIVTACKNKEVQWGRTLSDGWMLPLTAKWEPNNFEIYKH